MAAPTCHHLFVYGTLRRSEAHPMHRLLLPATFVGPGTFRGKLYDVGRYPAAILADDPAALIRGEVYLLHDPAATFSRLDGYEGCAAADPLPHAYIRTILPVRLSDGRLLPSQVYLYNHSVDRLTPIPSGDYFHWLARRSGERSEQ